MAELEVKAPVGHRWLKPGVLTAISINQVIATYLLGILHFSLLTMIVKTKGFLRYNDSIYGV